MQNWLMDFHLEGKLLLWYNGKLPKISSWSLYGHSTTVPGVFLRPYITVGMARHTGHFLSFEKSGPVFCLSWFDFILLYLWVFLNSSEEDTAPNPLVVAYLCVMSCPIRAPPLFAAAVLVWKISGLLLDKKPTHICFLKSFIRTSTWLLLNCWSK